MRTTAQRNFIVQQGFGEPTPQACPVRYSALQFQPRVVALVVLAGVVTQSAAVFLALGGLLAFCALLPRWNPFDALWNAALARRAGRLRLDPAPAPRRFAQGMAATFALAIGASLAAGWTSTAVTLQVLMGIAVAALAFGGFCLGSFVFHLLGGRAAFACRTLPWARPSGRQ